MRFELYELTFPNGKRYFGITNRSTAKRWKQHVQFSLGGYKKMLVCDAIRKHRPENVQVKTLVVGPEDYIKDLEVKCIAEYRTTEREFGYNLALGGQTAPTSSPVVAAKVSASMMGNKNAVGTIHTAETRAKLSAAKLGNKGATGYMQSEEHIEKRVISRHLTRLSKYVDASDLVKEHGPVKAVRLIATRMTGCSRKDIISACLAEGIKLGTIKAQL